MGLAVKKMVESGYKMTEVGVVPEDWEVKPLRDCLFRNPDYGINAAACDYSDDLPTYLRITDISDNGRFLSNKKASVSHPLSDTSYLEEGDLVLARTGASVGKSYLYNAKDGKLVFAGFLIRVKPNPNLLNSAYLKNYLETKSYWNWVQLMSMRSGQPGINSTEYSQILIPLPPTIAEQTAIANALSDADALINSLEKLIEKKRAIKQGAMQELLRPKEGWVVKKLGEVAEIVMGQSPLSKYYNTEGKGLPLIQGNADVKNRQTIIRSFTSQITKKGKSGDIIMSVRAPVGEISRAKFECCLGRGVCSINFSNDYLYHYLVFFEKSWAKYSTGSTFDSVNSTQVKELEINIPSSEEEQLKVAEVLSNMDSEIQSLETKLSKQKFLKQAMMQELLTGKTRLI